MYGAILPYVILYHRQQIAHASKQVFRSVLHTLRVRKGADDEEDEFAEDIHYKTMKAVSSQPGSS
jgi:hypothetical protein